MSFAKISVLFLTLILLTGCFDDDDDPGPSDPPPTSSSGGDGSSSGANGSSSSGGNGSSSGGNGSNGNGANGNGSNGNGANGNGSNGNGSNGNGANGNGANGNGANGNGANGNGANGNGANGNGANGNGSNGNGSNGNGSNGNGANGNGSNGNGANGNGSNGNGNGANGGGNGSNGNGNGANGGGNGGNGSNGNGGNGGNGSNGNGNGSEPPPGIPTISRQQSGANQAVLRWTTVSGASSYNVFYSTDPNFDVQNILSFPQGNFENTNDVMAEVFGLNNGTQYHFAVTSIVNSVESEPSTKINLTPAQMGPTAEEVRSIELINRARRDPAAFGVTETTCGTTQNPWTLTADPKRPLAHNQLLKNAAEHHSNMMIGTDEFSHCIPSGLPCNDPAVISTPTTRMVRAGYTLSGWINGENISNHPNSSFVIDNHHSSLFSSLLHRCNMLRPEFREIGVARKVAPFYRNSSNRSVLTQKFARSGTNFFITGVVYNDNNGNEIYDLGEGISGVNVAVSGAGSVAAQNAGIYSVPVSNGTYTVTFSGAVTATVENVVVNGGNVKVDIRMVGGTPTPVVWPQ